MLLKNEGRIEALFFVYSLALLVQALIERELRRAKVFGRFDVTTGIDPFERLVNGFASLAEVEDRLLRFQARYEHVATPFQWTFTRQDLAVLVKKIEGKRNALTAAA